MHLVDTNVLIYAVSVAEEDDVKAARAAAILAAARTCGCDVVYSEDLNAGQDYDGVRVVNPFA